MSESHRQTCPMNGSNVYSHLVSTCHLTIIRRLEVYWAHHCHLWSKLIRKSIAVSTNSLPHLLAPTLEIFYIKRKIPTLRWLLLYTTSFLIICFSISKFKFWTIIFGKLRIKMATGKQNCIGIFWTKNWINSQRRKLQMTSNFMGSYNLRLKR